MSAPVSSVWTDAEALFTHTLQPVLDAAATAEASGMSIGWVVGSAVVIGLAGLVGSRLWQDLDQPTQEAPASRPSPTPFSPVPMTRLLLLAALLVAAPAVAQTHAEAMAQLAPYHGAYSLNGTASVLTDDGVDDDGGMFDGALVVSPILGGHFQQWEWEMTMRDPNGDTFDTHLRFITTYDADAGEYAIWRFDSRDAGDWAGPGGHDVSGRLRFNGDALVMSWPTANPSNPAQTGVFTNTIRLVTDGISVSTNVQPNDGSPLVAIATTRATRR